MKIKAVCEATGLTDRTIRYYIEEKLISPVYSENYLGRKSFDFSDSDVSMLNDIAVLRKFGFSVAEIKEMILHPEEIVKIASELQIKKQGVINEEQVLLSALSRIDKNHTYTVSELASLLSSPVEECSMPDEDANRNLCRNIVNFIKAFLVRLIVWLPVVLSVVLIIRDFRMYHYPKVDPKFILLSLISLVPTILTLLLPKIKIKSKPILKIVLLVLCVVSIPVSSITASGIIQLSETTDFRNYLDFDSECIANRSDIFQELFPKWPHYFDVEKQSDGSWETVDLDAHYYYRFYRGFDYTYDIYAEWPLEKEEFVKEISRAKELFEKYGLNETEKSGYCDYVTIQKGGYTCLVLYSGDFPFEKVTGNYTYYIFAYDEQNLKVRYIYCDSLENGVDQPYYLELDW